MVIIYRAFAKLPQLGVAADDSAIARLGGATTLGDFA